MANSQAVISLYDEPMWQSIHKHEWSLQSCDDCSEFRYPPAPNCRHCLGLNYHWKPLKGGGTILSWVIYHRQYFDNFPPPYNVVAVQLDEGPIVISNLVGDEPEGSWVGHKVEICYEQDSAIGLVPKMRLKK